MEAKIEKTKLVCVEYPGVIENENKFLKTVGGEENISDVYSDPVKRLDLRWRPEDTFCKPACGNRFPSHKLLLRVKRTKVPDSEDAAKSDEMEAEILGIAETTFRFECMADFQYVAVKHDKETGDYHSFHDDVAPGKQLIPRSDWLNKEDLPLFLPAPLYARMDRPQDYAYKDRPKERKARALRIQDQPDTAIIVDRAQRKHFSKFHNFSKGAVPMAPYKEAEERLLKRPSYRFDKAKLDALKRRFEERPIWSRTGLQCTEQLSKDQLKFILPLVAYYWESGPWRTMWCKFGYDPRKEKSAKIYQLVDFRVRGARFDNITVKRSSTKEFNLPYKVVRSGVNPEAASIKHKHLQGPLEEDERDKATLTKDHLWKFRRDVLPEQRQLFYSAVDIEVDEVQQIIHSNDGQETECTEKDGWLVPGYADKIRTIMTSIVEDCLGKYKLDLNEEEVLESRSTRKRKMSKGKQGLKHHPKTSDRSDQNTLVQNETSEDSQQLGNEIEMELDDVINASQNDDVTSESESDSNSDPDDLESGNLETQRVLRTRQVFETTDIDVSDIEGFDDEADDKFTENLQDSDLDPEYDPRSDMKEKG